MAGKGEGQDLSESLEFLGHSHGTETTVTEIMIKVLAAKTNAEKSGGLE